MQRGERVVGHLRLGAGQASQQRRLAGVGKPDQAGVGEQPQPQLEPALLARQPLLGKARRLARGGGELAVAAPAAAAARHQRALAGLGQVPAVAELRVLDHGPRRHPNHEGLRRGAVLARTLPVAAALGLEVRAAAKGGQVAQRGIADDDHVAAAPAVAAVGPALGHVRLAPERDDPVAARARAHVDLGPVVEHVSAARRARTTGLEAVSEPRVRVWRAPDQAGQGRRERPYLEGMAPTEDAAQRRSAAARRARGSRQPLTPAGARPRSRGRGGPRRTGPRRGGWRRSCGRGPGPRPRRA